MYWHPLMAFPPGDIHPRGVLFQHSDSHFHCSILLPPIPSKPSGRGWECRKQIGHAFHVISGTAFRVSRLWHHKGLKHAIADIKSDLTGSSPTWKILSDGPHQCVDTLFHSHTDLVEFGFHVLNLADELYMVCCRHLGTRGIFLPHRIILEETLTHSAKLLATYHLQVSSFSVMRMEFIGAIIWASLGDHRRILSIGTPFHQKCLLYSI